jgi:hypothetical protein
MDSEAPFCAGRDLGAVCATMRFAVEPGRFVLLGFPEAPGPADLALAAGDGPAQLVREGGETTLLVRAAEAAGVLARHPAAAVERDLAWIRFEGALAWDVVGFLALVTGRLAAAGVPLGAVCGFSRDHLFVAEPFLARAREVLRELFSEG